MDVTSGLSTWRPESERKRRVCTRKLFEVSGSGRVMAKVLKGSKQEQEVLTIPMEKLPKGQETMQAVNRRSPTGEGN